METIILNQETFIANENFENVKEDQKEGISKEIIGNSISRVIDNDVDYSINLSTCFVSFFFEKNNLKQLSRTCFHGCHDSSSFICSNKNGTPNYMMLRFPAQYKNPNCTISSETVNKCVEQTLEKYFELFAKYVGATNIPKIYRTQHKYAATFLIDFTQCNEKWITSRVQRYMLLKFIRSIYISSFSEKEVNTIEDTFKYFYNNYGISTAFNMELIYQLFFDFANYGDEASSFLYEIREVYEYAKEIKKVREENQVKNSSLKVWSKHPSHAPLRGLKVLKDTIIRFGYRLKEIEGQEENLSKTHIIINPFKGIANSASKFLMKKCFQKNNVKTADWVIPNTEQDIQEFTKNFKEETKYIVKSEFGSRGMGLLLFENKDELIKWFNTPFNSFKKNKYSNYLVERYYPYTREYRLHVTKDGCFYTCRKMLKENSTERWYRNDSNSVWIVETNEMFQKPLNWKEIESQCVNALNSVGLDVGACDVRVQSARNSDGVLRTAEKTDFIICEINSAPGLGEIGLEKYKTAIHNIIKNK